MPLYEYRCTSCDEEFEEIVKMNTPAETVPCPKCGRHQSERKISLFASRTGMGGGATGTRASSYAAPSTGGCGGSSGFT